MTKAKCSEHGIQVPGTRAQRIQRIEIWNAHNFPENIFTVPNTDEYTRETWEDPIAPATLTSFAGAIEEVCVLDDALLPENHELKLEAVRIVVAKMGVLDNAGITCNVSLAVL